VPRARDGDWEAGWKILLIFLHAEKLKEKKSESQESKRLKSEEEAILGFSRYYNSASGGGRGREAKAP
jgi:hypothetical protein